MVADSQEPKRIAAAPTLLALPEPLYSYAEHYLYGPSEFEICFDLVAEHSALATWIYEQQRQNVVNAWWRNVERTVERSDRLQFARPIQETEEAP